MKTRSTLDTLRARLLRLQSESNKLTDRIKLVSQQILREERTVMAGCNKPIPDKGPPQCSDGHWLGSKEHPVEVTGLIDGEYAEKHIGRLASWLRGRNK